MTGTTPFVAPTYPDPLFMPNNTTPIEAWNIKDQHAEAKRSHLECKNVEKALMRHVQDATEWKCIELLLDEHVNLITGDSPVSLNYLFYNYGKVRYESVGKGSRSDVPNMVAKRSYCSTEKTPRTT